MGSLEQDLFTGLAFGTVSATLTIEGDGAEERPKMLADIFSYVSKGVYKTLVPRLSEVAQNNDFPPGDMVIEEQVKVELFGLAVTLDLKVQLNVELDSPDKEALRFLVIHWVGTEVAEDVVGRISNRLEWDTVRNYYKEHPEEASPFGLSLGGAIADLLRSGGSDLPAGARLH